MDKQFDYDVFLSHSSKDKPFVSKVAENLQKLGLKVWFDAWMPAGSNIPLAVEDGLNRSRTLVQFLSENSIHSEWVKEEASQFRNPSYPERRYIPVRLDDCEAEDSLGQIKYFDWRDERRTGENSFNVLAELIGNEIAIAPHTLDRPTTIEELARSVLTADNHGKLGKDLVNEEIPVEAHENEGVILIKPGGTFFEPCLTEIFKRIVNKDRIVQIRCYSGIQVATKKLFEKQYGLPAAIANGKNQFNSDDFRNVRKIYDDSRFEAAFGAPYDDSIVIPALKFCEEMNIDEEELTVEWNKGRAEDLFWNKLPNGLNKIGFRKTVFPIRLPGKSVRLVINGFIPGLRKLFVSDDAHTIAIHVATTRSWRTVRESIAGGSSNPKNCVYGSIRSDAYRGLIRLDPPNSIVNGQRNVCHSSATLLDGMKEVMNWFERDWTDTQVGRFCSQKRIARDGILNYIEGEAWDVSVWRNDDELNWLLYEISREGNRDIFGTAQQDAVRESYEQTTKAPAAQWRPAGHRGHPVILNGSRLKKSGPSYYLYQVGKMLRDVDGRDYRDEFEEIVAEIESLKGPDSGINRDAVYAEAVRVVANDLKLQNHFTFRNVPHTRLFRAQILAEMPNHALQYGIRTERNFVRDIQSRILKNTRPIKVAKIRETNEWREFHPNVVNTEDVSVIGLVLAGGRSTRMGSTIPKPALPFGKKLLLDIMSEKIESGLRGETSKIFTAIGFRSDLIRRVFGTKYNYLEYDKTLGVGFRVATCLHDLQNHSGLVVLSYVDTPLISDVSIAALVNKVQAPKNGENPKKVFGILTAPASTLVAGQITKDDQGKIVRISQERTDPIAKTNLERDAGLYVFHNTEEFRDVLLELENNNVRGEFIFADILSILRKKGWTLVDELIESKAALGINTSSELLCAASGIVDDDPIDVGSVCGILNDVYGFKLDPSAIDGNALRSKLKSHIGPLYFFDWWDKEWS